VTTNGQCGNGGVATATGTFTTNGVGGTVTYYWVRKDSTGTHAQPRQTLIIAKGNVGIHAVARDRWAPKSAGSEQLVFVSPTYSLAAQAFTCGSGGGGGD
jgi:hypothetical protein